MNKAVRKELETILEQIQSSMQELENIRDEEQDKYDNMPENMMGGERGTALYEVIDNLDQAVSSLEEAVSYVENAKN